MHVHVEILQIKMSFNPQGCRSNDSFREACILLETGAQVSDVAHRIDKDHFIPDYCDTVLKNQIQIHLQTSWTTEISNQL